MRIVMWWCKGVSCATQVDYWAFGVMLYELLIGSSPFEAEDPTDHLSIYNHVLSTRPTYPVKLSPTTTDLLSKLLQPDASRRYGNLLGGAEDVKKHAFYGANAFDWNNALALRISARAPEFDPAKYEWLPLTKFVNDKPCSKEEDAMFASFACN